MIGGGAIASSGGGVATYSPVTGVGWRNAYWAEGPEFVALGVANGGAVATWPDEIATQDLPQATAGLKPTYRSTGGPNSKPCIESDGSDYFELAGASMTALAQPDTIVMVVTYNNTGGHLIDGNGSRQLITADNGTYRIYAEGSVVVDGISDFNPHLWTCYFNGTTSVLEIDGTAKVTGGGGGSNPGTAALDGLSVLSGTGGSAIATADIAFLGLYSGDARTDGGWTAFEDWVETYYGITVA